MAEDRTWLASPVFVTSMSALFGLLGTGFGAVLQGYSNTTLERQKFEAALIQKALETPDKKDAAKNLKFLVDAGLITQFDLQKLSELAGAPDQLPVSFGASRMNAPLSVAEAKAILQRLGLYAGAINGEADQGFREAVAKFQQTQGLPADGVLGPLTGLRLKNS